MFVITKEWFNSNRDFVNGLNRPQAEAIGEKYPLKKGWKERVLGKEITPEQKLLFENSKGMVYSVRKNKVKNSRKLKNLESDKEVLELQLEIAQLKLELLQLSKKTK